MALQEIGKLEVSVPQGFAGQTEKVQVDFGDPAKDSIPAGSRPHPGGS